MTESTFRSHERYRPDIDGLRAVAVFAVVGFHAFPEWIPGGFIGVDVFFVISGFLISMIIMEDLDRGTFTFRAFYARRIRRLVPALLVVLLASLTLGWQSLVADEMNRIGRHVAGGAGFVSNLMLWGEVDIARFREFPLHPGDDWDVVWDSRPHWREREIPNPNDPAFGSRSVVTNAAPLSPKRVWVVGDSFTGALRQFLNATFREVRYQGHWLRKIHELPVDLRTASEKPDVLLLVIAERAF